jgi:hypothetical protein
LGGGGLPGPGVELGHGLSGLGSLGEVTVRPADEALIDGQVSPEVDGHGRERQPDRVDKLVVGWGAGQDADGAVDGQEVAGRLQLDLSQREGIADALLQLSPPMAELDRGGRVLKAVQDPKGLADQGIGGEVPEGEHIAGGELDRIGSAGGPAVTRLDDLEVLNQLGAELERGRGELVGVVREEPLLDAGKRVQQVVLGWGRRVAKSGHLVPGRLRCWHPTSTLPPWPAHSETVQPGRDSPAGPLQQAALAPRTSAAGPVNG